MFNKKANRKCKKKQRAATKKENYIDALNLYEPLLMVNQAN
jgi:hypothetical protein